MALLLRRSEDISTALHVLLEHLDASLDIADAMASVRGTIPDLEADADTDAVLDRLEALQRFAGDMRTLEAALLTKVRQSRHWAERLARLEPAPDASIRLFLSGTVALTDAIERMARPHETAFETGDQLLPYLRDRGLVPPETLSLDGAVTVPDTSHVLIAGWVPLADYMALVAETLEALADAYGFATWDEQSTVSPPPSVEVGSVISGGKDAATDAVAASMAPAMASADGPPSLQSQAPATEVVVSPSADTQVDASASADGSDVTLSKTSSASPTRDARPETKAPNAPAKSEPRKGLVARVLEVADGS